MLVHHIALVADTPALSLSDLTKTAAAIQKQVTRDFYPFWKIHATVSAFANRADVPVGYWPVLIGSEGQGGGGVHLDESNQPYALVDHTDNWTLAASHECLEMLVDPFGNRMVAGRSIMPGQGRVSYLVEVCDPCEAPDFAYGVNGITVSDFYTPHFFDPKRVKGNRYSYTGAIHAPHTILPGGYLSWMDPATKGWWQQTWFKEAAEFVDLGVQTGIGGSIRAHIDRLTSGRR